MQIVNRMAEVGLNTLQLMYCSRERQRVWTLSSLAGQLRESELFLYKVIRVLKEGGYVYSILGNAGGYVLLPYTSRTSLKQFIAHFDREYTPNPTLSLGSASVVFNRVIDRFLSNLNLVDVFDDKVAERPIFPDGGAA